MYILEIVKGKTKSQNTYKRQNALMNKKRDRIPHWMSRSENVKGNSKVNSQSKARKKRKKMRVSGNTIKKREEEKGGKEIGGDRGKGRDRKRG